MVSFDPVRIHVYQHQTQQCCYLSTFEVLFCVSSVIYFHMSSRVLVSFLLVESKVLVVVAFPAIFGRISDDTRSHSSENFFFRDMFTVSLHHEGITPT